MPPRSHSASAPECVADDVKQRRSLLVTTGFDPVVHADLQLRELAGGLSHASVLHGWPDHLSEDALRAFAGNDEERTARTEKKKEAERRETLFNNLRPIGDGSHPFRNALAYRRSTTALT
jgi:hypothetical protein